MTVPRSDNTADSLSAVAGFVLPITLALIVALAFLLTVTLQQINDARARAQIFSQTGTDAFEVHALEQEIIFQALSHLSEKTDFTAQFLTTQTLTEDPNWKTNGERYFWSRLGTTESIGTGSAYQVSIQDTSGLLDVNNSNLSHLLFLSEYMGVPAAKRRLAIRNYAKKIEAIRDSGRTGGESIFGLKSPELFCEEPIWNETPLCQTPEKLVTTLVAGRGGTPRISQMPGHLKAHLLPDLREEVGKSAELLWVQYASEQGFYDPFTMNAEHVQFAISITPPGAFYERRFVLNLLYDLSGSPYSIVDRGITPLTTEQNP